VTDWAFVLLLWFDSLIMALAERNIKYVQRDNIICISKENFIGLA